jgi:predicted ArsR family transcriptional regulator
MPTGCFSTTTVGDNLDAMTDRWDAVATLADDGRRALFEYVQSARHAVSREEAAEAVGVSRGLAAFHLDKLVEVGLLRTRYEAPADVPRGRGRTPKVYEPTASEVAVSMPERDYGVVAQILADAIADDPRRADTAALRHARHHGQRRGARLRSDGVALVDGLRDAGYDPGDGSGPGEIVLANCPFHALATRHTALVCGINLELLTGLLEGMQATDYTARLAPKPGRCCVTMDCACGCEPTTP